MGLQKLTSLPAPLEQLSKDPEYNHHQAEYNVGNSFGGQIWMTHPCVGGKNGSGRTGGSNSFPAVEWNDEQGLYSQTTVSIYVLKEFQRSHGQNVQRKVTITNMPIFGTNGRAGAQEPYACIQTFLWD